MRRACTHVVAFLLACASSAVMAQPLQDENLLVSVPAGWDMVTGGRKDDMTIFEYVPKGETVDDWTQMITVQIFHRLGHVPPKLFVDKMTESIPEQAANGTFRFQNLDVPSSSEYPSSGVLWLIGAYKSIGKGEITVIRAIQGKDALYVVQKAWRQAPFTSMQQVTVPRQAIQEGMEFVKKAKLVDARKTDTSNEHVDKQL